MIEQAEIFVVDVVGTDGCVVVGIGGDYDDLEKAIKSAKSITKKECEKAGAFDCDRQAGVQVTITAGTKDDLDVAADGCNGNGLIIYNRFI